MWSLQTDERTDDGQQVIRKAHLSFQLRWGNKVAATRWNTCTWHHLASVWSCVLPNNKFCMIRFFLNKTFWYNIYYTLINLQQLLLNRVHDVYECVLEVYFKKCNHNVTVFISPWVLRTYEVDIYLAFKQSFWSDWFCQKLYNIIMIKSDTLVNSDWPFMTLKSISHLSNDFEILSPFKLELSIMESKYFMLIQCFGQTRFYTVPSIHASFCIRLCIHLS